jgi:hypothetical protein
MRPVETIPIWNGQRPTSSGPRVLIRWPFGSSQALRFESQTAEGTGELLGRAHVKDRDNVGVVEIGNSAGFAQVGFGVRGRGDKMGVRNLDGDESLQTVVISEVNEAEASLAQQINDPIATDVRRG